MHLQKFSHGVVRTISKNAPAILTALGATGVVTTTVLAVKATPEALRRIWDAESEQTEPLTNLEKVKLTWTLYLPSAIVAGVSISAIIGAQGINSRRQTALMGLYTLSEKALTDYQEKTLEQVGEKAESKIREAVAEKTVKEDDTREEDIYRTGKGLVQFIDGLTGRKFYSDMQSVRSAVNSVNEDITKYNYCSQNQWYYYLGLPSVQLGDEIGWNSDNFLEVAYPTATDEKDVPCFMLDYITRPINNFWTGHKY